MSCCRAPAPMPDEGPVVGAGCTGGLTRADTIAVAHTRTTAGADPSAALLAAMPAGLVPVPVTALGGHAVWQTDLPPPLPDRIIAFLHLLI